MAMGQARSCTIKGRTRDIFKCSQLWLGFPNQVVKGQFLGTSLDLLNPCGRWGELSIDFFLRKHRCGFLHTHIWEPMLRKSLVTFPAPGSKQLAAACDRPPKKEHYSPSISWLHPPSSTSAKRQLSSRPESSEIDYCSCAMKNPSRRIGCLRPGPASPTLQACSHHQSPASQQQEDAPDSKQRGETNP